MCAGKSGWGEGRGRRTGLVFDSIKGAFQLHWKQFPAEGTFLLRHRLSQPRRALNENRLSIFMIQHLNMLWYFSDPPRRRRAGRQAGRRCCLGGNLEGRCRDCSGGSQTGDMAESSGGHAGPQVRSFQEEQLGSRPRTSKPKLLPCCGFWVECLNERNCFARLCDRNTFFAV